MSSVFQITAVAFSTFLKRLAAFQRDVGHPRGLKDTAMRSSPRGRGARLGGSGVSANLDLDTIASTPPYP